MLGISKERRAGSYGAGTKGAIIGRGVVSERVSNVCHNSHTCQQQTASAGSGWGLAGHSSPQSIPLLHPRMTMVIHWKLTKKMSIRFGLLGLLQIMKSVMMVTRIVLIK